MAAMGIIIFFVVLGLGTVFVAMRGGPKGASDALHSESRAGRRGMNLGIAAMMAVFGAGVPALVLLDARDEQASAGPGGTRLNTDLQNGRDLFATYCATCHSLDDANAVGRVGPDLDVLRPAAALSVNAIQEGRARGMGQMPAQLLDGDDAKDVALYVEKVAGR